MYSLLFKSKSGVLIHSVHCYNFDELSAVCSASEVSIVDLNDNKAIGEGRVTGLRKVAVQVLNHINKNQR